jgi:hypothetical protein
VNRAKATICFAILCLVFLPTLLWSQEEQEIGEIDKVSAIATHYDQITPIVMSAAGLIDGLYMDEGLISSDPQSAESKALAVKEELTQLQQKLTAVAPPAEAEPANQLLLIWFDDLQQVTAFFQNAASPNSTMSVADCMLKYQQAKIAERSDFESAKQAYIKLLGDYGIPLNK